MTHPCSRCLTEVEMQESINIYDEPLYVSRCTKCRRVESSADGIHWTPVADFNGGEDLKQRGNKAPTT